MRQSKYAESVLLIVSAMVLAVVASHLFYIVSTGHETILKAMQ